MLGRFWWNAGTSAARARGSMTWPHRWNAMRTVGRLADRRDAEDSWSRSCVAQTLELALANGQVPTRTSLVASTASRKQHLQRPLRDRARQAATRHDAPRITSGWGSCVAEGVGIHAEIDAAEPLPPRRLRSRAASRRTSGSVERQALTRSLRAPRTRQQRAPPWRVRA